MKRKNNLYQNICDINNITKAYNEVCRNTTNKKKVALLKQYKCIYISRIYQTLVNKQYIPGPCNIFTIYEPKERRIISQSMEDKIINHLISREILYPAIIPCLLDVNVASRKNLGTKVGLSLAKDFHRKCKIKYSKYFILKCDISKFFANIDHTILKEKLKRRIKDPDALKIIYTIIDSEKDGLGIGAMTSQTLAIFYLNDLDHFIKEQLKIKYYVRYQDDFLLFHHSKKYLKYCLEEIKLFLKKEKLTLNKKSRIYNSNNNFIFLGCDIKGNYAKYRSVNRKIKSRMYLYRTGRISLNSLTSSIICYKHLCPHNLKIPQKNSKIEHNI